MSKILSSATKITLIVFALTTCAGFLMKLLSAELFIGAVMLVLGFYFGSKKADTPITA